MVILQVRTLLTKSISALGCALMVMLLACGSAAAQVIEIRPDSPSQYAVVRGDTLWDIAGKFLAEPWLWPQVWQLNPQIENPDLIYPGDVIELVYENGSPVLRLSRTNTTTPDLPTIRLSPRVRREAILSPIPAISLDQISALLSDNYVIQESEYEAAPYLLAETDGRTLISKGDEVYGRGAWLAGVTSYDIVRSGQKFKDPDTGKVIGLEAITVGSATLNSLNGERAILSISDSYEAVKAGDRLIPKQGQALASNYMPAPPDFDVNAAIISIGSGRSVGGLHDTLLLNKGKLDGISVGQILAVREPTNVVRDTHGKQNAWQKMKSAFGMNSGDKLEFPGENVGTVLIYRVFEGTSLALVLKSPNVIRLYDRAGTP